MKHAPVMLLSFFLYRTLVAHASDTEKKIRQLEKEPCDAIVQHDSAALYKIWVH